MSSGKVKGARILTEDYSSQTNHLVTFPRMYENAKEMMSSWLQRLPSGPSPRGPGH
ncbi:hypothetical protein PHJA_001873000 [Phtheirospermum japonicum]|uniref:Uncharacterized protein n=1 Tax=Phtheirospermum japonicum TaxID=374723 RepID=A0A830CE35_9LAMI|nr:hypothetical protein PHJA_001873000 [Phtheirospermum japonicum]